MNEELKKLLSLLKEIRERNEEVIEQLTKLTNEEKIQEA